MSERHEDQALPAPPSFADALGAAVRRSGFAKVAPGEAPTASSLLAAIGGVRGLVEAILPGLLFLIVYTITEQLVPSAIAPVAVAVVFVIVRLIRGTTLTAAFTGVVGVALSAGLALFSGRAEDNFMLGFVVNGVSIAVLTISLLVRWPFIGVIVGMLGGDLARWRTERPLIRVAQVATVLWIGVFTLRLAVQLPLYLAAEPQILAATKLIMGVPLYAAALWLTWTLVRAVHARSAPVE